MNLSDFQELIGNLQNPSAYPHPTGSFHVIETHISWVILTGTYAYKIKKPVDFGFLDFGSEEKREFFCGEEIRLNRRLAQDVYIDVVPITGSIQNPRVSPPSDIDPIILTHAVRMHQFPEGQLLNDLAGKGELSHEILRNLALCLADFHVAAATAPEDSNWGTPDAVAKPILANFEHIRKSPHIRKHEKNLAVLESWSIQFLESHRDILRQRRTDQFIRECHGDLHLNNILWWKNKVIAFDCLEFNPSLRFIDVMSEVAFLVMDLKEHNLPHQAIHFLNEYLGHTGDYEGCRLLPIYISYRAMVRAKVAALGMTQISDPQKLEQLTSTFAAYLSLALSVTQADPAPIIITHGFSGSGKSTHANQLAQSLNAIHIRSDVERKRLFGIRPLEKSPPHQLSSIYSSETTRKVYDQLASKAAAVHQAHIPVIIDATFLKQSHRNYFKELAQSLNAPFHILDCTIPIDVARERLIQRQKNAFDPSEATLEILDQQIRNHDPLDDTERAAVLSIPGSDR